MIRKFGLIFAFLVVVLPAGAKDLYVAANQVGTGSGTGCSTAKSAAWLNNTASWGTGAAQIGPGTTVHLCGTFTGGAGQQFLLVHGNGSSTAPITIKFQPGAILTAPYWSGSGAIRMDNRSYITVDGGGSGLIRNTANGTGLAYHMASKAIYAPNCTGCKVQNLIMANIYVHTSMSDLSAPQTQLNCIYMANANDFTINHVTCHDAGWAFNGAASNLTIEYSEIYNIDHGLAFGPQTTTSGLSIHDNHIHGYANWDNTTDIYHHDGLHIWGQNGGVVTNGVIFNNLFDGDSGVNITAHIYIQDSVRNVKVFNNVFLVPSNRGLNVLWFEGKTGSTPLPGGPATGNSAYNNFIRAGGHTHGSALSIVAQFDFTAVNNVLMGGTWDVNVSQGGSFSSAGINNNVYEDLFTDAADYNSYGFQGKSYHTLASWQAACRCDSRSKLEPASKINASSAGQLLSGSVAISAAANLLNISSGTLAPLSKDKIGAARQSSGGWDAGAYKYGSVPLPMAPTGVTATIQ
jgi:hypothetical protein